MLDRICGLLKEVGELKGWIAKRLAVVVDHKDETISPKNFAVIKVEHSPPSSTVVCFRLDTNSIWDDAQFLSMQRACHYLIGRLVRDYAEANEDSRWVYLVGLATLLARVGSSVTSLQHEKIIPLLLEALKLPDVDVKLDSLVTIHDLIENDKRGTVFENHLSSLVSALLINCTFGRGSINGEDRSKTPNDSAPKTGGTSASVRLFALKILALLPSKAGHPSSSTPGPSPPPSGLPSNVAKGVLQGQRNKVLLALSSALDDPKRDVRKIAVDCRAHWFSLNLT
ncbi:uncharacterized protein PGTG_10974 [Puccinia graminis f. sp. tritici CRL 75-36-700-3]|uniref:MMS19 nucleotide excision repair protein n=1 Tax=Puccinia graminis f. sp. tritici (strain CRL 75-36-700-3 / race SCCL) TaxID=418459 RepID=E3KN09_PUCGT|nr:uncharacterized protein PGTG_10974 [Puccinia graminis f. sp. tritici CRL 75-36-700-3]EFP85645.2 hypothetical protein PGTG_10974 [Puccinia graminis f. sp. tritici CRL 75-36-700-3]